MSWLATSLPDSIAAAAAMGTMLAWYEARRVRRGSDRTAQKAAEEAGLRTQVDALVTARISSLGDRLHDVELTHTPDSTRAIVRAEVASLTATVTSLETKMDVVWTAIAANMARVLHQPDPRRRHIDVLLEKLTEGTLDAGERDRLRGYLRIICDWEPGTPADFPVHPGEQVAAAILLSILDHELDKGGARRG